MILHDDWVEQNWEKLHERNLEQYRKNEILANTEYWGSKLLNGGSSFRPEFSSLIKALMILPTTWDIEWVSDPESSIQTV